MAETEYEHPLMKGYREQLGCGFPQVAQVFEDCMAGALAVLSREGVDAYLEYARFLCKMGRGVEPVLIFLEEWPSVTTTLGEAALPALRDFIHKMHKSPNGKAIVPFLQCLAAIARRLHSREQMQDYMDLALDFMERTTGSIHGIHTTFASPGLPEFFQQTPFLLSQVSIAGLKNWVEYGIRNYHDHPDRQRDYFNLKSADSRAMMQRERSGTLLFDNERKLDMTLRGMWNVSDHFVPYSLKFDELRKPIPYFDKLGIRLPDVYDDRNGVAGIDRYRAVLAHIVGHKRWTTAIFADNMSQIGRAHV